MRHLVSVLTYGLILLGLLTLRGELLVLAIPFVVYLGAGLLFRPNQPRVRVERHLSADRAAPDAPVVVTLRVTNEGQRLEQVHIEDFVPLRLEVTDGQPSLLTALAPAATVELTYTLRGKRGDYRFSAVRVTASEYLGLARRQVAVALPGQLVVLPEVVRLRDVAIRPRRTRVYAGTIPARQGGPGVEFFGVRAYQPGDPTRWINARISARHQEALFVNEFEQERAADVGMILDARGQANLIVGQHALFEHAVAATAALSAALLARGNRVGMLIYGRGFDWTVPGYGKLQRERMLRALASATTGDSSAFARLDELPTRLFPARAQLVLVSALLVGDYEMLIGLRARGFPLLIVSPDPIAFESESAGASSSAALAMRIARLERDLLMRRLRHAGIQVVNWRVDTPLHQMAEAALSRPPAFVPDRGGE